METVGRAFATGLGIVIAVWCLLDSSEGWIGTKKGWRWLRASRAQRRTALEDQLKEALRRRDRLRCLPPDSHGFLPISGRSRVQMRLEECDEEIKNLQRRLGPRDIQPAVTDQGTGEEAVPAPNSRH